MGRWNPPPTVAKGDHQQNQRHRERRSAGIDQFQCLPLGDLVQICIDGKHQRIQQHVHAVGIDQRAEHGQFAQPQPAADVRIAQYAAQPPRPPTRLDHRPGKHTSQQRQAAGERTVQVGPQTHHQRHPDPQTPRHLLRGGADRCDPRFRLAARDDQPQQHREQQRAEVLRTDRRNAAPADDQYQHNPQMRQQQIAALTQKGQSQQPVHGHRYQGEQRRQRLAAARRNQAVQNQLRQPGGIDHLHAFGQRLKRILGGQRPMLDDPTAVSHMPPEIRFAQRKVVDQIEEKAPERNQQQMPRRQCPARMQFRFQQRFFLFRNLRCGVFNQFRIHAAPALPVNLREPRFLLQNTLSQLAWKPRRASNWARFPAPREPIVPVTTNGPRKMRHLSVGSGQLSVAGNP